MASKNAPAVPRRRYADFCNKIGKKRTFRSILAMSVIWVNSGKHLLALSFSGFDPTETLAAPSGNALDAGFSYQRARFSR
jgi:hypothetical protein